MSPLTQSVSANQTTYQSGEPIQFTAVETNVSDEAVTILNVNDVFTVTGPGGATIPAANVPTSGQVVTLQPGQSQTFAATWNPTANAASTTTPSGTQVVVFYDNLKDRSWSAFTITSATSSPSTTPSTGTAPSNPSPPTGSSPRSPSSPTSASTSPTSPTSTSPAPVPVTVKAPLPVITSTPSPIAATLTTNHSTSRAGKPVVIKVSLKNIAKKNTILTSNLGNAFTVLEGSKVVWKQNVSIPKTKSLKPGESIQLTETWNGRPNQAGLKTLAAGVYTIEFNGGGYFASANITID